MRQRARICPSEGRRSGLPAKALTNFYISSAFFDISGTFSRPEGKGTFPTVFIFLLLFWIRFFHHALWNSRLIRPRERPPSVRSRAAFRRRRSRGRYPLLLSAVSLIPSHHDGNSLETNFAIPSRQPRNHYLSVIFCSWLRAVTDVRMVNLKANASSIELLKY